VIVVQDVAASQQHRRNRSATCTALVTSLWLRQSPRRRSLDEETSTLNPSAASRTPWPARTDTDLRPPTCRRNQAQPGSRFPLLACPGVDRERGKRSRPDGRGSAMPKGDVETSYEDGH
jgi:hypothetical protein